MSLVSTQATVIRKRDGRTEPFDVLKIGNYLRTMSWGLDSKFIDVTEVIRSLTVRLPANTITSDAFLILVSGVISELSSNHPDYSVLAGRVYTCYQHKLVPKRFSAWVLSYANASPPVICNDVIAVVRAHSDILDAAIIHQRDFDFTYPAITIFERLYMLKEEERPSERLQFLFMRVSIGIHGDHIDDVLDTYHLLSTRKISFASPVLLNGGLANQQFTSSYIFEPVSARVTDADGGISTLSALWSANGGIGVSAGCVPATGASGSNAHPGLMSLLRIYESIGAYWSKSSRHTSSFATVHIPIWHSDVRRFAICRMNRASPVYRFRHLFPTIWIPNLFMQRLESNDMWSLFDPAKTPGLTELYGDAFQAAYQDYEAKGIASTTISARGLWEIISNSIRESGCPFIMFADNVNAKNNQMHLGIIKASNLCANVVQYSSTIKTAVCTFATVCLPRYQREDGLFNYAELHRVTKLLVRSLDRLIDLTAYPTADAAVSAYRTRSIAIGVQGLADIFTTRCVPFTSDDAKTTNKFVYETIYHAGLESSAELAEILGPYDTWTDSPAHRGVLQVDMWGADVSDRYDFTALRDRIRRAGLRNSVLTAQMPIASSAQLFGTSDGMNPYISNIVQYHVPCGTCTEVSRPLVTALCKRRLWTEQVRRDVLAANGSIQTVPGIPDDLKAVFRTAFEINQRDLIDMAVERGPFIDQSQSLTLYIANPTPTDLMNLQLRAWQGGLKTGLYYVRSNPALDSQQFGP